MTAKEKKGPIGFDPLAWMNEDHIEVKQPESQAEIAVATINNGSADNMDVRESKVVSEIVLDQGQEPVNDSVVILDATLNIQNVTELHQRFVKLLDTTDKIGIDASAVVSIDTSTLQLLIVLKQTASKLQKQVEIDFPSEKFIEAAGLLGLSELLDVNQSAAGFF
ncbi:MAG: STAS domain-containing protein [Methylococcales bacterium]|nr:STAS domain-containing protein [Methylococcales bacterium]